jgi:uncharacterized protein (TIGR03435 family)
VVGRFARAAALTVLVAGAVAHAQPASPQRAPSFDVASVKPNNTATDQSRLSSPSPGRFVAVNTPLRFIVLYAFDLMDDQLIAMPGWTSETGFDIRATYPPTAARGEADVQRMVRGLLADRFGFVAHAEKRELPVYSLVLARRDRSVGPRLVPSQVDCGKWKAENRTAGSGRAGQTRECVLTATRRAIVGRTRTIAQLTPALQSMVGRRVLDQTGLSGAFNIDLEWNQAESSLASPTPASADGPSIFTALQEQLGLRLVSGRAPVDVLVVDAVNRPDPD